MMIRQRCAAMVVGGPTTVLDLGGLRVVSDPTFDPPGPHGYLTKTEGPAVAPGDLTVTAVPAVHGPEDGERDADGFVNCEVIGFILSGEGLPTVYLTGDNASIATVGEIARRVPSIDAAVLHAGAARVESKFRDRPVSMDSIRAAAAAAILAPGRVIPAHYDGWAHFTEGPGAIARAFDDAGLAASLELTGHATWIPLNGDGT
jgi:L-ascorbate metabolism protein UlaG (beta-lactamase superfamily)